MSYILDALKKSEQERQKTTGPTLQSIHRPPLKSNRNNGALWVLGSICIVLSIILTITVWRYLDRVNPLSTQTGSISNAMPSEKLNNKQTASTVPVPANTYDYETINPNRSAANEPPVVVDFSELPDPIQKEIPALTFSFHVYSENPVKRTIIINKHRVKQGDTVAEGLTLKEITVNGIVLKWKHFYFRINVVEQW